jgi:hypothetical protein
VGDFSSRANRVESDHRGEALVEMTVVDRAGLSLGFSDLTTVSLESGRSGARRRWSGNDTQNQKPFVHRF